MELRADVYNRTQLEQAISNNHIGKIYAPYQIIDDKLSSYSDRIIVVPHVFLGDCEEKITASLMKLRQYGFDKALAHTIGHIQLLHDIGFNVYGSYRLNCINSDSIAFYSDEGVSDIILSPEMSASQINNLSSSGIGFIAYGYLPLMITRRCPIKNDTPCNKKCCNRTITDRKGNKLSIICSETTAEILNSDVLYLADKMNNFRSTDFAVLKFTIEDNIKEIIDAYVNAMSPIMNNYTRGLYFRSIKE